MPTLEWNKRWALDLKLFCRKKNAGYYGIQWGDPSLTGIRYWIEKLRRGNELPGDLSKIVQHYILPYVTDESVVLEIGAGGGRWTQYMLRAKQIIVVELNAEFFPYLQDRFKSASSKFQYYETSGYELNGIESDHVDFIFSFGTFVHIDQEGINTYLAHIKRVMKPHATAVIHYSDKTKRFFQEQGNSYNGMFNEGFSEMNPITMQKYVSEHGFKILDHNISLLIHSNIAVIQK